MGRLARSTAFAGTRLGETLLMDAIRKGLRNSRTAASWAVIVDAKNERAVHFREGYGFIEFPNAAQRLFLPISTVEQFLVGLCVSDDF